MVMEIVTVITRLSVTRRVGGVEQCNTVPREHEFTTNLHELVK